jgi:membrane protein DedA with SNARE-associated domain
VTTVEPTDALPRRRVLWIGGAIALMFLVLGAVVYATGPTTPDETDNWWAYLSVFLLVTADGVCPVFPGETTLNAASTLAVEGDLLLGWIIVAGALGAICGDSSLYWLARYTSGYFAPKLEAARRNDNVDLALRLIGSSAPALLVFGRYVPGMRFVVNATFGIARHPYQHFLLWSAVGGTTWSIFTCSLAYAVATILTGYPLMSIIASGLVTTVALTVVFFVGRKRIRELAATPTSEAS